jgi:hypothetical protein
MQMVVYLPSALAHKPVFAGTLKAGSEDTLSVFVTIQRAGRPPRQSTPDRLTLRGQGIGGGVS